MSTLLRAHYDQLIACVAFPRQADSPSPENTLHGQNTRHLCVRAAVRGSRPFVSGIGFPIPKVVIGRSWYVAYSDTVTRLQLQNRSREPRHQLTDIAWGGSKVESSIAVAPNCEVQATLSHSYSDSTLFLTLNNQATLK
jgi:hypothetical protein